MANILNGAYPHFPILQVPLAEIQERSIGQVSHDQLEEGGKEIV